MNLLFGSFTQTALLGCLFCACRSQGSRSELGSDPSLAELDQLIAVAEARALANNTRKTYDTGFASWANWAKESGLSPYPACPLALQRWICELSRAGLSHNTISTYHAGVAHRHRELSGLNPANDLEVRRVLSGLKRMASDQGQGPKQAYPLRWYQIELVIEAAHEPRPNQPRGRWETVEQAQRRGDMDIALFALSHDAALRGGETLALTWADIDPPGESGCATVQIRKSKTDQLGEGAVALISDFTYNALTQIRPAEASPHDRIFNFSHSTLNRKIKAATEAAGMDSTNFSSHSLRIGMLHDLAAADVNFAELLQAGRWTSARMVNHYIRNLAVHQTSIAKYLSNQSHPHPKTSAPHHPDD